MISRQAPWWAALLLALVSLGIIYRDAIRTGVRAVFPGRDADLAAALRRDLPSYEPAPPVGTRFFFASLPPRPGFRMRPEVMVRDLYRDLSVGAYFYPEFSESTAAGHPCRFMNWDGTHFVPLYPGHREPWFQVGVDLLMLGRPAGASHAFRRGLATGEERLDHLYWLGWAELWSGRRAAAEAAWQTFGARDDPAAYAAAMVAARDALLGADTLTARRRLFEAIQAGIGRPEAHGALGDLLQRRQLKYGLLELKVAAFLSPRDMLARRDLARGLVAIGFDDAAREVFDDLARVDPAWEGDSTLAAARRTLDRRSVAAH